MTRISKVAVIGLGNIGQVVAANLAKSNRPFIAASRDVKKAEELAGQWGAVAEPLDIPTAVKEAEIVLLSIPYSNIAPFLKEYAADLEGKIIIDPSNPIAPDSNGEWGLRKIIGDNESAGELIAQALPENAKLAKALGTLAAATLADDAFKSPDKSVLFYATDDTSIDDDVEQLIKDTGFEPLRVGKLDQSTRIEVFGDLHEYGALGKTVTLAEAKI